MNGVVQEKHEYLHTLEFMTVGSGKTQGLKDAYKN